VTLQASRRAVLTGAAVAAAHAATAPPLNLTQYVSGAVFHERTGSSAAAGVNPGVGGVLVSNGFDVVATDSDGRWRLPWRPGCGVFAIKPQGWAFTREQAGLRHGWRPHVAPDQSIVFGLIPSVEPAIFEVALLADTQPQTDLELDYLRDTVLDDVARSGAAFAINHGDVVFDDLSLYDRYLRLVSGSGMTWHHCPGNHDMNGAGDGTFDRFAVWKRKIGPTHYAFEFGRCTFIILNNVAPLPPGQVTPTGYDYSGNIGQEQLAFVRNLLARTPRDRLVILSMHIPLVGLEAPDDPAGHTADRAALLHLLADRPHAVSFAGHTHTTEHHYLSTADGRGLHHHHVLTAASGSWWSGPFDHRGVPIARSRDGNPRGFHLMSIEGHRYTTRFVPSAEAKGEAGQFALCLKQNGNRSLLSDGRLVLTRGALAAAELVLNVYDGGPRTKVGLDLKRHGLPHAAISAKMERVVIQCPSTLHHFERHRSALKSWVEACPSSHVWTTPLPPTLPAGVYAATATIHDEYGREQPKYALIELLET
jgi:C terminal of Calcineurin-like phosphoesterase/Calcineurin-like phosphoesterase